MSKRVAKIGRPPAGEIEKRKQKILSVATKLFIAKGYDKTTLAEIGREAGVTKRTIYDHIGDKDTLFQTICMECLPQSLELHFEPHSSGKTARESLKILAKMILDYSLSDENINLTRMLMVERQRFPDLVKRSVLTLRELCRQHIEDALNEMMDLGMLVPSRKMDKIAYYFYDIIVGGVHTQMLFDLITEPPTEAEIDQRIHLFLFGYQALEAVNQRV